ncbi:MAG TPA: hypothetical protein ENJ54_00055 [Chloroflexi bacterium]|nr:hypothetical protein [Chloroflexota bacterium]
MKRKILFSLLAAVVVAAVVVSVGEAGFQLPPGHGYGNGGSSGYLPFPRTRYTPPRQNIYSWREQIQPRDYVHRPWMVLTNPSGLPGLKGGGQMGRTLAFVPWPLSDGAMLPPASPPTPRPRPRPTPRPTPRPAPVTCTPTYAAPSLYADTVPYNPPHPVVIGQDPLKTGVDVTFKASGGRKTNNCPRGAGQQRIVEFRVLEVQLAQSSREWIATELAKVYPGAYIKGQYPLPFKVKSRGLGYRAALTVHIDPPDPGFYDFKVEVKQADGQKTVKWFSVPVYLLETTLIH